MDELLPCPFCGEANAYASDTPTGWVVTCDNEDCYAAGPRPFFASKSAALMAWNRRAPAKTETTEDARTKETTDMTDKEAEIAAKFFAEGMVAGAKSHLSFRTLAVANRVRCTDDFHEALDETSTFTPSDWGCMVASEAGEVADAVLGWSGKKASKSHLTLEDLGSEIADVVICCDLLAMRVGLNLEDLVRATFNRKSDKVGSKVKLP